MLGASPNRDDVREHVSAMTNLKGPLPMDTSSASAGGTQPQVTGRKRSVYKCRTIPFDPAQVLDFPRRVSQMRTRSPPAATPSSTTAGSLAGVASKSSTTPTASASQPLPSRIIGIHSEVGANICVRLARSSGGIHQSPLDRRQVERLPAPLPPHWALRPGQRCRQGTLDYRPSRPPPPPPSPPKASPRTSTPAAKPAHRCRQALRPCPPVRCMPCSRRPRFTPRAWPPRR